MQYIRGHSENAYLRSPKIFGDIATAVLEMSKQCTEATFVLQPITAKLEEAHYGKIIFQSLPWCDYCTVVKFVLNITTNSYEFNLLLKGSA